jgi:drug/metabolite transporter (DMT)-like permease
LSEPVTPLVWLGMGLVGAGIYLVNRPSGSSLSSAGAS